MVLTGSDEAYITLTETSADTQLELFYQCDREAGVQILSLRISPTWLTLWLFVALAVLSLG